MKDKHRPDLAREIIKLANNDKLSTETVAILIGIAASISKDGKIVEERATVYVAAAELEATIKRNKTQRDVHLAAVKSLDEQINEDVVTAAVLLDVASKIGLYL